MQAQQLPEKFDIFLTVPYDVRSKEEKSFSQHFLPSKQVVFMDDDNHQLSRLAFLEKAKKKILPQIASAITAMLSTKGTHAVLVGETEKEALQINNMHSHRQYKLLVCLSVPRSFLCKGKLSESSVLGENTLNTRDTTLYFALAEGNTITASMLKSVRPLLLSPQDPGFSEYQNSRKFIAHAPYDKASNL